VTALSLGCVFGCGSSASGDSPRGVADAFARALLSDDWETASQYADQNSPAVAGSLRDVHAGLVRDGARLVGFRQQMGSTYVYDVQGGRTTSDPLEETELTSTLEVTISNSSGEWKVISYQYHAQVTTQTP
jgi:hypothetical protein